ncbi:MAG TPA: cytochrome c [Azospirillum sp.]|nr:cytochrome c [Azospirillum sp.]
MRTFIAAGASAASLLLFAALAAASPFSREQIKRGEYLATIMDCSGCHTTGALQGKPDPKRHLGGSQVGFQIPDLGTFYPPNITQDPDAGIGRWTEADIVQAVRTGIRPDGRILAPVMPYHNYGKLTDEDAEALAAYLMSVKPVPHKAPALVGPSGKPKAPYLAVIMPE